MIYNYDIYNNNCFAKCLQTLKNGFLNIKCTLILSLKVILNLLNQTNLNTGTILYSDIEYEYE